MAGRPIDLPPGIVWSALTDPELLAGWLGEVIVTGERFRMRRLDRHDAPVVSGSVTLLEEPQSIALTLDGLGEVTVLLEERTGGLRDTWTTLHLIVPTSMRPAVEPALDRLEAVLRGHPTNWAAL